MSLKTKLLKKMLLKQLLTGPLLQNMYTSGRMVKLHEFSNHLS